jgi:hypothetical protein
VAVFPPGGNPFTQNQINRNNNIADSPGGALLSLSRLRDLGEAHIGRATCYQARCVSLEKGILMRRLYLAGGLVSTAMVWGQTQIDLSKQTKNVDFSSAIETRPIKTGIALPGSCVPGDMYFKTNAAPGSNVYACTANDTWTQASGTAGGSIFSTAVTDAQTTVNGSLITIQGATYRTNNVLTAIGAPATIRANSGSLVSGAQIWIEFDPVTQTRFLVNNANVSRAALSVTNITLGSTDATGYTPGRIAISTCTGGGTPDTWTECTDARSPFSTVVINQGSGIQIVPQADGSVTISATNVVANTTTPPPVTTPSNPVTYFAAGPAGQSCPSALTAIGSYQFPASADIAPGDQISVDAYFKRTGASGSPIRVDVRYAGSSYVSDAGNWGAPIYMGGNFGMAFRINTSVVSSSVLAHFAMWQRDSGGGFNSIAPYHTNLVVPANLLIEFVASGCSNGDTVELRGATITLHKAASL